MDLLSILNNQNVPPYGHSVSSVESSPSPRTPRSGTIERSVNVAVEPPIRTSIQYNESIMGNSCSLGRGIVGDAHWAKPPSVNSSGSQDGHKLHYNVRSYPGPTTSESSLHINHRHSPSPSRKQGFGRVTQRRRSGLNTSTEGRGDSIGSTPLPHSINPSKSNSTSNPFQTATAPSRGLGAFCHHPTHSRVPSGFSNLRNPLAFCNGYPSVPRMSNSPIKLPSVAEICREPPRCLSQGYGRSRSSKCGLTVV